MKNNKTIIFVVTFIVTTILFSCVINTSETGNTSDNNDPYANWKEICIDTAKPNVCDNCGGKVFARIGFGLVDVEYEDSIAQLALEGDTTVTPYSSLGCEWKPDPHPVWSCLKCGKEYGLYGMEPPEE